MYTDETSRGLISLTLEDDSPLRLHPLVNIQIGDYEYLALNPPEEAAEDVYFYEFIEHGEHEIELLNIENEGILEAVMDEFEKCFDEQYQRQERDE